MLINAWKNKSVTMKQSTIIIFLFILGANYTVAQIKAVSPGSISTVSKPDLDTSMLGKWPLLGKKVELSNDGKHVAYIVNKRASREKILYIQGIDNSLKQKFPGVNERGPFFFCDDNKQFVFQQSDSLFFVPVKGGEPQFVPNVESSKYPKVNHGKWLAYRLKDSVNELVLINLLSFKTSRFSFVTDYSFDAEGNTLLLRCTKRSATGFVDQLQWMNLREENSRMIWERKRSTNSDLQISNFEFDDEGMQCAFTFNEPHGNSIWYYHQGMDSAVLKVNNESRGISGDLVVQGLQGFSRNGKYLFFYLEEKKNEKSPDPSLSKVNIWSYKDLIIQPVQRNNLGQQKTYLSVVSIDNRQILQLQSDNDDLAHLLSYTTGDYLIMTDNHRGNARFWWPHGEKPSTYSVSLKDGTKKLICTGSKWGVFSPLGKYFVYWDVDSLAFMSYHFSTGRNINLTRSIPEKFSEEYVKRLDPQAISSVAAWFENDQYLIVYDKYDIWKIDPLGKSRPINLTNGFGRKNKIMLRLVFGKDRQGVFNVVTDRDSLLLTGVSELTKDNGFFKIGYKGSSEPALLTMEPYVYYKDVSQLLSGGVSGGMQPVRARNSACWLTRRESAKDYENYFVTKDFKTFTAITNLCPQESYNWLTTELITWKMFDGKMSQGVLYKPENFDPQKKYPIIFEFYETRAERLNDFPIPDYSGADINIPWFVSNGYLVFSPDIHYGIASKTGQPFGECAYNAVVSAAEYLSKMSFVDGKKMAINGASFGAAEASYIVTHSNLFAAASEVAGFTDPVSFYLNLLPRGPGQKFAAEELTGGAQTGRQRYGANLWERPDLYLKNSAVLSANKATTPLLIMHNPLDDNVGIEQGIELYLAFRRLGKKCWMLEYDEGGHGVDGKDAVDYNTRLTQFYDHYLKDAPAPKWMTQGLTAKLKQIETGYGLDSAGNCGKDCKICMMWNQKMKKNSVAMMKEIQEKFGNNKIINSRYGKHNDSINASDDSGIHNRLE